MSSSETVNPTSDVNNKSKTCLDLRFSHEFRSLIGSRNTKRRNQPCRKTSCSFKSFSKTSEPKMQVRLNHFCVVWICLCKKRIKPTAVGHLSIYSSLMNEIALTSSFGVETPEWSQQSGHDERLHVGASGTRRSWEQHHDLFFSNVIAFLQGVSYLSISIPRQERKSGPSPFGHRL